MSTRNRRRRVRGVVSYLFESALIDAVLAEAITTTEAENIKFQLSTHLHLHDLFSHRRREDTGFPYNDYRYYDPEALKDEIRTRLRLGHKPVPLPDRAQLRRTRMRVIVGEKAGHSVDPAFLDKVAADVKPTCVGTASFNPDEGLQLEVVAQIEKFAEETLPLLKEGRAKDRHVIYFFDSDSSEGLDSQPYIAVLNKDGDPVLAAFGDGDFVDNKSFKKLLDDYLTDELTELYERGCDSDIVKTMQLLASERWQKRMSIPIVGGTIMLIGACQEAPVIFTKSSATHKAVTFDWGMVSNGLNFGAETKKSGGILGAVSSAVKSAVGIPPKATEKAPVKADAPAKEEQMLYKVPNYWGKKNQEAASKIMFNTVIQGTKKGFEGMVDKEKFAQLLKLEEKENDRTDQPLKKKVEPTKWAPLKEGLQVKPFSTTPPVAEAKEQKPKDTAPHRIPTTIVPVDKIKPWGEFLLRVTQVKGTDLPSDIGEFSKLEQSTTNLLEALGLKGKITDADLYGRPKDWWVMVAKEKPDMLPSLAHYIAQRSYGMRLHLLEVAKGNKKDAEQGIHRIVA